jgi:hypothetical protein
MKNLFKVLIITVCVITGFSPTGCMKPPDYTELLEFKPRVYPSIIDFNISGLGTYICGEEYTITVTPKPGMTQGDITVYYEGNNYPKSNVPPVSAGAYTVTFNVDKAKGFFAVSGMVAGLLIINNLDSPKTDGFFVSGLEKDYELGETIGVKITPKDDKLIGKVTIYYEGDNHQRSQNVPIAVGEYTVTFDVEAVEGYSVAAYGLPAGTLIINNNYVPKVEDFKFKGLGEYFFNGKARKVEIETVNSKVKGSTTVHYTLTSVAVPDTSDIPFSDVGTYSVTFDVEAVEGYNTKVLGLHAGTIIIKEEKDELIGHRTRDDPYFLTIDDAANIDDARSLINNRSDNYFDVNLTGVGETTITHFQSVKGLTSLTIDNVKEIRSLVFSNCKNLKEVNIKGNGSAIIASEVFFGCISLQKVYIDGFSSIGDDVFEACHSLKEVTLIGNGTAVLGSSKSMNNLENVHIEGVQKISGFGSSCNSVKTVFLGKDLKEIKMWTFNNCSNLQRVTFEGTIPSSDFDDTYAFYGDLRDKFYETDPVNGTPGTYTTNSGVTWTRQQ